MFGIVLPLAAAIGIVGMRRLINVGEPTAGSVDASASSCRRSDSDHGLRLRLIGDPRAVVSPAWLVGGGALVIACCLRQLRLQKGGRAAARPAHPTHRRSRSANAADGGGVQASGLDYPATDLPQDLRGLTCCRPAC